MIPKNTSLENLSSIAHHQSQLGINRAVGTSRADIERIEGIGAVGMVFEKVFF